MTTRTYVSDLVGEEYKSWDNESIILDCGTGTGKTKFILSVLAKYAYVHNKNMLYLCNRKKLREQIQYDVGHLGFSNVEIESYQQLQKKIEDQESIKHYVSVKAAGTLTIEKRPGAEKYSTGTEINF